MLEPENLSLHYFRVKSENKLYTKTGVIDYGTQLTESFLEQLRMMKENIKARNRIVMILFQ